MHQRRLQGREGKALPIAHERGQAELAQNSRCCSWAEIRAEPRSCAGGTRRACYITHFHMVLERTMSRLLGSPTVCQPLITKSLLVLDGGTHSFVHPFIHASIHSCIHSFIHACMHPFIHPCIHSFIHSCMHPFIHPFIHSLMHPFIQCLALFQALRTQL